MKVWVSGSIAYDRIMDYAGSFADHINPDKVHVLNVSFAVPRLKVGFGGTAGNIAYNLRLLSVPTGIVGCIGKDGADYKAYLQKLGVDISVVRAVRDEFTSGAYIITDRNDNQVTGFVMGAMSRDNRLPNCRKTDWAVVAAQSPRAMVGLARHYKKRSVPFIFDPGQQITAFTPGQLRFCLKNCRLAVGNDYEIDTVLKRIGYRMSDKQVLAVTLGAKGSIIFAAGKRRKIPAARAGKVVDPTGAGDAYRAGLIKGMIEGFSWDKIGRLASVVAVHAVEKYGTQNHKFTWNSIKNRFFKNFKQSL